jgi:hypothetical protein
VCSTDVGQDCRLKKYTVFDYFFRALPVLLYRSPVATEENHYIPQNDSKNSGIRIGSYRPSVCQVTAKVVMNRIHFGTENIS